MSTMLRAAPGDEGESHFVRLDDDLKVHYTAYGKGQLTLIFVHGWACDETVWDAQVRDLGRDMRCLTIDLPGHGGSDQPQIAYTMPLYARAIDAVLKDAHATPAVVVGHSNGVPAIRQFYRERPGEVRALVIVDGGLRPFVDQAAIEKFVLPLKGPDYPAEAGKFISAMTQPIPDQDLRDRIKKLMLRTPQHVAVSEFEHSADPAIWKPDPIRVPVLMILAKQPAWNADYEKFVRSIIPHLDYQLWDHISHFIMMEKPLAFNDGLRRFLQENNLASKSDSASTPEVLPDAR